MPIYPIKGSTASAIQAINAGNATVSHRVARVNGFDGTANHLIYTADCVLLDGSNAGESGGWSVGSKPNGTYQDLAFGSSGVSGTCTAYINKTLWTSNKVDLSQFTKMTVTFNVTQSSNDDGTAAVYNAAQFIAILANTSMSYSYSAPSDYDTVPAWGTTYQKYWEKRQINHGYNFANGVQTYTVDISGWNATCHLGLLIGCGPGNTLGVTFSKLVLE